ncbi:MAG: AraC family transcriptional regulator, partial [Bosea sp. (in: a-proteobacteria)]
YGERIGRVMTHIADHPDRLIDLDRLAGIACFSPWHFHRIYRAVAGENVAESYRRHRLHRAATELLFSDRPLSVIAQRAGFGSSAAFIRSFSAAYGSSPGIFRRKKPALNPPAPPEKETLPMPDMQIVTLPAMTLAAVAHKGEYNEIGAAFTRLAAWAGPRGLYKPNTNMIGLYYDDPDVVARTELRSHACIEVRSDFQGDSAVNRLEMAQATYARCVHKGPYAELFGVYQSIFREWLPASGHEPTEGPSLEEYLNDPQSLPPTEWLTAIHIPIKS